MKRRLENDQGLEAGDAGARLFCMAWRGAVMALLGWQAATEIQAQAPFYFGNDLSYVNEMEDCGAVFRENDVEVDPFVLMAQHGTNLVRVRLWNDPYWQELVPKANDQVQAQYSNLQDVTKTIRRSRAAGMAVILDFHFSDFWADPGRQVVPRAWAPAAGNDDALARLLYEYVREVLTGLDEQGLMPEIVSLGNETNPGLLVQDELMVEELGSGRLRIEGGGVWRDSDERLAKLWNAGIRATREIGASASVTPKIALHAADPSGMMDYYDWMTLIGVTDFDIAGISYYYGWHGGSITETGRSLRAFREKYPQYEAMILETGYPWDGENIDGLGNIIEEVHPDYAPLSPEMQRQYLVDLTQEVIDAGGSGVIVWEPLWVSTPCYTPWGRGSSHEHVAYFDHRDSLNLHAGGTWMSANYDGLPRAMPAEGDSHFRHPSGDEPINDVSEESVALARLQALYPFDSTIISSHTGFARDHYPKRIAQFRDETITQGSIVMIGDSLTEDGGDWSTRLADLSVFNRGIKGDNTEGVLARLGEIVHAQPKTIFIMIGTNDLWTNNSPEKIASNIGKIGKSLADALPESRIFVQTVMPLGLGHEMAQKLLEMNTEIQNIETDKYEIIDTYSHMADVYGALPSHFTTDGVHLTEEGYDYWVQLLNRYID